MEPAVPDLKMRREIRCRCSAVILVFDSQAGAVIRCTACEQRVSVPPLSTLQRLPGEMQACFSPEVPPPRQIQFGMQRMFAIMAAATIVAAVAHYFSLPVFFAGVLCLSIVTPIGLLFGWVVVRWGENIVRLNHRVWDFFLPLPPEDE